MLNYINFSYLCQSVFIIATTKYITGYKWGTIKLAEKI